METPMAHVKLLSNPALLRVFYGVDAPVGRGCPNRGDDVYLVQFFLNAMWGKKDLTSSDIIGPPGTPAPAVDGICGPKTVDAIRHFQEFYAASVVDGRVDPMPPGQRSGPLHHKFYTVIGLNTNFATFFGTDRHALICNEPNFPIVLKQKMFM
jgi:Putative peptidoglycan binding domain